MSETKRLYYTDSYLTRTAAEVTYASDDGLRVRLNQSNFYPTSGGQPHDTGTLNGIEVMDVVEEGDSVTHILAAPLSGSRVEAQVLWSRRYDHMQQHTGQHLLSAVFEQLFQIPTLSFRMGEEASTIELGTKSLSRQQIAAVVLKATELARANPPIQVSFEEAAEAQGLRKASEREGMLRIVEIPGIDRSACGGTHVAGLGEVLPVQIRDVDRVRGNVRIGFVCGNRAMSCAQSDFEMLCRIAASLGASRDGVEAQIAMWKQHLAESEKQRQRLEIEAATRAGLDLYDGTTPSADGIRRVVVAELQIDEAARSRAKAFASQSKAVVLMHGSEGLLVACSADSGLNVGALFKKFGARGGGSATLAQGSLPDAAILRDLMGALGLSGKETT